MTTGMPAVAGDRYDVSDALQVHPEKVSRAAVVLNNQDPAAALDSAYHG